MIWQLTLKTMPSGWMIGYRSFNCRFCHSFAIGKISSVIFVTISTGGSGPYTSISGNPETHVPKLISQGLFGMAIPRVSVFIFPIVPGITQRRAHLFFNGLLKDSFDLAINTFVMLFGLFQTVLP
jgi:hypothetical protein